MNGPIFVTGGLGFIGSHTCIALADAGYEVIIYDNLGNSQRDVLDRLQQVAGRSFQFIEGDIRDSALLDQVFSTQTISAVIHFAGLKAVGESVAMPLEYFDNNVSGTVTLLRAMRRAKVSTLVFSSSATVYGNPDRVPTQENAPRSVTSPYGRCKLMIEDILHDLIATAPEFNVASLRYFNPAGAHHSGLIGEAPMGRPNNLMPHVMRAAFDGKPMVDVFGGDYPTCDGTGVRDYVHVMDVADGHLAALRYLHTNGGSITVNLGRGEGTSVLQLIHAFERASGRMVPHRIVARRPGDIAECWADTALAKRQLDWTATRSLQEICADAWRWQVNRAG